LIFKLRLLFAAFGLQRWKWDKGTKLAKKRQENGAERDRDTRVKKRGVPLFPLTYFQQPNNLKPQKSHWKGSTKY